MLVALIWFFVLEALRRPVQHGIVAQLETARNKSGRVTHDDFYR
jgi:hypothetical protein